MLLIATLACNGVEGGVEFDLTLTPITPTNQDPFADLESLQLTLEPARGEAVSYELSSTSGSPVLEGLGELEDTRVAVEGYIGEELVTFGRSPSITITEGDQEASLLVAQVDAFGWFNLMTQGSSMGAVVPDGLGRYFMFGGTTGISSRGGRRSEEVLVLDMSDPEGGLTFQATEATLPSYTGEIDGETYTTRMNHTATLLAGVGDDEGLVLITGGADGYISLENTTYTATLFNPSDLSFTPVGDLASSRTNHHAVLNDAGDVVILGGWGAAEVGFLTGRASAEYYDRRNRSFEFIGGSLPGEGPYGAAANLGPTGVLYCGGVNLTAGDWYAETGCRLISASYEMSSSESLPIPLAHLSMAPLGSGSVLVTGGLNVSNVSAIDQRDTADASDRAFIYNATSDSWTETGSLQLGRSHHRSVALPDGRVLIIGGATRGGLYWAAEEDDGGSPIACAEIYDPEAGTFELVDACDADSVTGSLPNQSFFPTVAADPTYGVLVVGGVGADLNSMAGLSLFVPPPADR